MKAITRIALAGALCLILPVSAARADDIAGAMVGGSIGLLSLDLGLHSGTAVLADGVPRTDVSGGFGMIRFKAGMLLRVTRFGSEAGLEGSFGLGWISGAAFGGKEEARVSADLSGGVVVVPLRLDALGGFALKLAGGFGTDHDVDYFYAGARLGFGEAKDADFGLEVAYGYRYGEAPANASMKEHHVTVMARISELAFGVTWVLGETAGYRGVSPNRTERFPEGTMRKGDYGDWMLTVGYSFR